MLRSTIIPNPKKLENTERVILKAGAGKIYVLADFDKTLTKAFVDGKSVPSLISVLRDGNYLAPGYSQKAKDLFAKYHPIEIDPAIPMEEKKKAMRKWWAAHFNLLIKFGLNKKDIESVVESGKIKFRQGVLEMLDFLKEHKIPLVILSSSGLGRDVIAMFLKKKGRLYDNIYIVSNSYKWDKAGRAVGIKKPIIHCMNKDETMIQDFPAFEAIKERKNVLLLGDSLGDVGMVSGFDYDNLIKVGFLNNEAEKNLEEYKRNYDILILNDGSMDYVNRFLKEMTHLQ